ncbi:hypothetical protein N0B31_14760 [Salinirubellus salinus]|uniref:Uncharacterized protein n=1 Tax=Salinirubellus salinus TaxID=1364945 RepID=A0A9E7R0I4_9EURY|nr:hypothetical protein [Salinirubellus salinus]UWM53396.1 hypothetical protein N0B31_14760 [Salinirubellus salinus]
MSQRHRPSGASDAASHDEGREEESQTSSGTTRRRLLVSGAATWATVGLAGCGSNDGTETPTATATEAPTTAPADQNTETPEPQPENFVVTTETWAGGEGVPAAISFMSACATTNTFVPGMQAVFFVGIYDPETGEKLTPDDLDGAQVNVGDGMDTVELSWTDEHGHATRGEGNNWVGSWMIPEDMDPGGLPYTVEVTRSDGDATFQNVGVLTDSIEIVEYDDPTNYVVDAATHWVGHPAPEYSNGFVGACAPEREYTPEMDVTFVIGLYDSTSGLMVGQDGLVNPNTGEAVEDETTPANAGIDSVTVVSPDGAFDDVALSWTDALDDENDLPRWFGTLETENLDPGTYAYEVQISDQEQGRFDVGVASAQFSIIEVPESA